jgi:thiol-disulfide isomerase/thioredoxin
MELQNVVTGETFKLADFSGQVVVLEAMAVWCPICLQQQRELVKAKAQVGDDVRFVSVDLGPNENKTILKRHVEGHGFDWAFAVPNRTFTRALANDTSRLILDPTIAPVIIIDKDGGLHLIGSRRVKSAGDLVNEIAKYQG